MMLIFNGKYNHDKYEGEFTIKDVSHIDENGSPLKIGELDFLITYEQRGPILLDFFICLEDNTPIDYCEVRINITIGKVMKSGSVKISHTDRDTWHPISEFQLSKNRCSNTVTGAFSVIVDKNCTIGHNSFATLYNDTSLTDFELRCEHGSIPVHRVVLAVSSPVLKTFLESENSWIENRWYKFSEVDMSTLNHLKAYIYLGVLPEKGLDKLLLLASCYMMEELKMKCISKILANITPENALEISKFAIDNKMTQLYLGFLKKVQDGQVKVDKIPID